MKARQAAHPLWVLNLCAMFALTLTAAPAGAQYTAPGRPIPTRHIPSKAEFQDKIEGAPWKTGPLALDPWVGLQDFRIVTELSRQSEAEGEDLTLTVGAGLRGYLPAGPRALFAVHALPEYVWWQDNEDKRNLNGRYGLGLFAFFNRLNLELSQRRVEQQSFFSSEIQELTTSRNDISTFSLELKLTSNVSLLGIATLQDYRNTEAESIAFSVLDRKDESGELRVQYEIPRGWRFEIGYADTSADFAEGARDLSNSGSVQLASVGLERPRFGFRLDFAFEEREADGGSDFGRFDDTTGNFAVLLKPSTSVDVLGYVRRALVYSTDSRYTVFLEERQGARINFNLDRVGLGLFGEIGEDDFEVTSPVVPDRIDDVTAYGAELEIKFREVSLGVRAIRTDYESGSREFDRDVTSVQFNVELAAISRFTSRLIDKLSLGSAGSLW